MSSFAKSFFWVGKHGNMATCVTFCFKDVHATMKRKRQIIGGCRYHAMPADRDSKKISEKSS